MAKKGDWVQIHTVVLPPEERSSALPEDTKANPLEMWVKGYLQQDAEIGDEAEVITRTGRRARGEVVKVNPYFEHNFGFFIPEVLEIGNTVRKITFGGEY
ncbi:MAG: 2-amino-4-ketopentanoate thiolase [Clostridia bacterium]|nr:2-amino-4-ketopentanoate thiolase [Clostridia bacterium]